MGVSPGTRSAPTWPPGCCTATTPTARPPPGSAGPSANAPSESSPGKVGVGKTAAARAALATLDPSRHIIIYLDNPTVGTRGIHHTIVTALDGQIRVCGGYSTCGVGVEGGEADQAQYHFL